MIIEANTRDILRLFLEPYRRKKQVLDYAKRLGFEDLAKVHSSRSIDVMVKMILKQSQHLPGELVTADAMLKRLPAEDHKLLNAFYKCDGNVCAAYRSMPQQKEPGMTAIRICSGERGPKRYPDEFGDEEVELQRTLYGV